jgi:hypothetical protein
MPRVQNTDDGFSWIREWKFVPEDYDHPTKKHVVITDQDLVEKYALMFRGYVNSFRVQANQMRKLGMTEFKKHAGYANEEVWTIDKLEAAAAKADQYTRKPGRETLIFEEVF